MVVHGVPTTAPFHCLILENEEFKKGNVDTGFIPKHQDSLTVRGGGWRLEGLAGRCGCAALRRLQSRCAVCDPGSSLQARATPHPSGSIQLLHLATPLTQLQEPPKMKDMSIVSEAGKRNAARRKHARA